MSTEPGLFREDGAHSHRIGRTRTKRESTCFSLIWRMGRTCAHRMGRTRTLAHIAPKLLFQSVFSLSQGGWGAFAVLIRKGSFSHGAHLQHFARILYKCSSPSVLYPLFFTLCSLPSVLYPLFFTLCSSPSVLYPLFLISRIAGAEQGRRSEH